jgi:hypothetical protein
MFNQNAFQDDDCKKIYVCCYCGELSGKGNKFCPTCRTQKGRQEILEANKQVLKDLRAKGYCLNKVELPVI